MFWHELIGYEKLYHVSDLGDVRSARSHKLLPFKSGRVTLSRTGSSTNVHKADLKAGKKIDLTPIVKVTQHMKSHGLSAYPWWVDGTHTGRFSGDAGEALVCAELLIRGVSASYNLMAGSPYDVLGDFGMGNLFTVQVKSTRDAYSFKSQNTPSYHFSAFGSTRKSNDIVALVALDIKTVLFIDPKQCLVDSMSLKKEDFIVRANGSIDNVLQTLFYKH